MDVTALLSQIDSEIAHLQAARAAIASLSSDSPTKTTTPKGKRRGRPKGSTTAVKTTAAKATAKKSSRRVMSPEGKARIAAAQKKRWAAVKKAA